MVWALKTLRPYLLYEKFVAHTDHATLRWLLTIQEPSGRLLRWRFRLAEYNFHVMYKKGPQNVHADALSRLRTATETVADDWDEIPSFLVEEEFSDVTDDETDNRTHLPRKLRFKQSRRQHLSAQSLDMLEEVNDLLYLDHNDSD